MTPPGGVVVVGGVTSLQKILNVFWVIRFINIRSKKFEPVFIFDNHHHHTVNTPSHSQKKM